MQPSSVHTFLLTPPCLTHRHLALAALVHLLNEQTPLAPCVLHTPRANVMLLQPSAEHTIVLLSSFLHLPRIVMALLMHASVVQGSKAPCLKQTNLPRTCGVSQSGLAQDSFSVCLLQKRPFDEAGVAQPSRLMCRRVSSRAHVRLSWWSSRRPSRASCSDDHRALYF